jgi:hypothetical protein
MHISFPIDYVRVLVLILRCTSVTLNTQKIDGHVQISQSNNHVFICLSSLMTSNQSSKFNKILKDNKDACEYSINQRHHCKPNKFFSFSYYYFFNKRKQMVYKLSTRNNTSSSNNQKNNQYSLQLKVDIVLNVQTNACEY